VATVWAALARGHCWRDGRRLLGYIFWPHCDREERISRISVGGRSSRILFAACTGFGTTLTQSIQLRSAYERIGAIRRLFIFPISVVAGISEKHDAVMTVHVPMNRYSDLTGLRIQRLFMTPHVRRGYRELYSILAALGSVSGPVPCVRRIVSASGRGAPRSNPWGRAGDESDGASSGRYAADRRQRPLCRRALRSVRCRPGNLRAADPGSGGRSGRADSKRLAGARASRDVVPTCPALIIFSGAIILRLRCYLYLAPFKFARPFRRRQSLPIFL